MRWFYHNRYFIGIIFFLLVAFFFYPVFKGFIPFPGDLLVSEVQPYRSFGHLGYAPGGVPSKAQGPDVIRQLFPWKNFAIESYKNYELPLWNPYNFAGNPLAANFQSGVFYPLNSVFLLSDFPSGWTIFIFLIPFLSCAFTYLFLRELNLSKLAAFFGGVVFAFSSYMVVWLEWGNIGHTLLWLPLALFFTERFLKKPALSNLLLLIAALTFSCLAGYIQGYFYVTATVLFYFLTKHLLSRSLSFKQTGIFVIGLVVPLLLAAFQLLPTLELFSLSSRSSYNLDQITHLLNPAWYLITIVAPDFFGNPATRTYWFEGTYIERVSYFGLIPFVLAVFAILNYKLRKEVIVFALVSLICLVLTVDLFFTKFFYLIPVPVISTTVPTRLLSLFVFSGSILGAFGLEFLFNNPNRKKLLISILIPLSMLLCGWFFVLVFGKSLSFLSTEELRVSMRNLILPTGYLLVFACLAFGLIYFSKRKDTYGQRLKSALVFAIIIVTLFDLFYFFHKITPFSHRDFIYPQNSVNSFVKNNLDVNRYWGYGQAYTETNTQTYEKAYFPDGYDPLNIKRYNELLSASKNGSISGELSGPDAVVVNGYGPDEFKNNIFRQQMLNLLGVKYILHKTTNINPEYFVFPEESYELVWQKDGWQVYENKDSLPRYFLANNYTVENNKQKIVDKLLSRDFLENGNVVLEEEVPGFTPIVSSEKSVELLEYTPSTVIFRTNSKSDTLLFFSDSYYPGWEANVDGKKTKIYRANYAFRAVLVPAGEHQVSMEYKPKSFYIGLLLSSLTFIILIITWLILRRRRIYV